MKKTSFNKKTFLGILFGLLLLSTFNELNAQDSTYNYLIKKQDGLKIQTNYFGALTFEHQATITNTKPGIELGVIVNKNLMLGVYGSGTVGNFGYRTDANTQNNIMFGEGGFMLGYINNSKSILNFGGVLKTGWISLVSDDKEMKLFEDIKPKDEDWGMVFHPEVFAELNLSKVMKVKLGVGYSFYSLNSEKIIPNSDLNSWTMNLGIVFGNFAR